jgi:hypothetical protein
MDSPCDVYRLWPDADRQIKWRPSYAAINRGGPNGMDTVSDVWSVREDPLHVPGCKVCLVKFLDGSPATVRYHTHDIRRAVLQPY